MPPVQVGERRAAGPHAKPTTLRQVQHLARRRSLDALTALIGVYTRPDGMLDRTTDGRLVVAAASTVLKWAYGEPQPYDPTMERPETRIDLEGMTLAERKRLLEVMDRITTVVSDTDADQEDGPDFDPSRFATEQMVIEAQIQQPDPETVAALKVVKAAKAAKLSAKKRAKRAQAAAAKRPHRKSGRAPKRVLTPRTPKAAAAAKLSVSLFDESF